MDCIFSFLEKVPALSTEGSGLATVVGVGLTRLSDDTEGSSVSTLDSWLFLGYGALVGQIEAVVRFSPLSLVPVFQSLAPSWWEPSHGECSLFSTAPSSSSVLLTLLSSARQTWFLHRETARPKCLGGSVGIRTVPTLL